MVVEYAFLDGQSFSTGILSLKVYKQNLCTALDEIDVLGGATATPICERGKILKILILPEYIMMGVYNYVFWPQESIPNVVLTLKYSWNELWPHPYHI